MSAEVPDPGPITDEERRRLRRAFDLLPKVAGYGDRVLERHDDVLPERVCQVIAQPYERYEIYTLEGERRTVVNGRVRESRQWITVVFVGDPESGRLLTAFHNRQLEREYGGRPWRNV